LKLKYLPLSKWKSQIIIFGTYPIVFSQIPHSASAVPPLKAPFPPAYSFSVDQASEYVDKINGNLRFDSLRLNGSLSELITPTYNYFMINFVMISPIPCIYYYENNPPRWPDGEYLGTVLLANETNKSSFDIYYDLVYYAFDSVTNEFKAQYDSSVQQIITNWNPTPPPSSIFTPPSQCYLIPGNNDVNHSAPNADGISFPTSFSMFLNDGNNNIMSIYYNADNQMSRFDSHDTTSVQIGNNVYRFPTAFYNANPPINPLPCSQFNNQSFFFSY